MTKVKEKLNIKDTLTTMDLMKWSKEHVLALAEICDLEFDQDELIKAIDAHEKLKNKT